MKAAANVINAVTGLTGLTLLVLGVAFWTGHALTLVPLHMALGSLFVLAMWALCIVGIRAHLPAGLLGFTFVWSLVLPLLGYIQIGLLPGPAHWVIRVLHLLVAMVAMGLVGRMSMAIRRSVAHVAHPQAA